MDDLWMIYGYGWWLRKKHSEKDQTLSIGMMTFPINMEKSSSHVPGKPPTRIGVVFQPNTGDCGLDMTGKNHLMGIYGDIASGDALHQLWKERLTILIMLKNVMLCPIMNKWRVRFKSFAWHLRTLWIQTLSEKVLNPLNHRKLYPSPTSFQKIRIRLDPQGKTMIITKNYDHNYDHTSQQDTWIPMGKTMIITKTSRNDAILR